MKRSTKKAIADALWMLWVWTVILWTFLLVLHIYIR